MHHAPSVSYPVGRSPFAAALLLLAWLLGAVSCALWWIHAQASGWRLGVATLMVIATGSFAAWSWWRSPGGTLAWDGEGWSRLADGRVNSGTFQVGLDLQRWLLLHWNDVAGSQWLWLGRTGKPGHWNDLRRAVYSRPRLRAPTEAEPFAPMP
jgi:toxin CptA